MMSAGYYYCPYIPIIKSGTIIATVDTTLNRIDINKDGDRYLVRLHYTSQILSYSLVPVLEGSGVVELMDDITDCIHFYGRGRTISIEMGNSFWTTYREYMYIETESERFFIRNGKNTDNLLMVMVVDGEVFAPEQYTNHEFIEKHLGYFQCDVGAEHPEYW